MNHFITNLENELRLIFTNINKGGNSKTFGGDNQGNTQTDNNNNNNNNTSVQPVNPPIAVETGKTE
jgi:hypothetical protein